jgi:hypothetical protein
MIIGTVLSEQHVYNGIYNSIRLKLVALGVLPDRTLYLNVGLYNAAVEALRLTGKTIIEVRNVNAGISRQDMNTNTFYINLIGRENGDFGGGKATIIDYQNEEDKTRFRRIFQPARPQDLNIEVSFKTEDIETDQFMRAVLLEVLGERNHITSYSDDGTAGDSFWLMFNGEVSMDKGKMLDKRARYTAKDLILISPIVLKDNIPPATTITPVIGADEVVTEFPTE